MEFEFSDQDQMVTVYHLCEQGTFQGESEMLIEANTGLPALSTHIAPPLEQANKTRQFDGQAWHKVTDHRGKIAYSKDRSGDDYEITILGELPDTYTLTAPQPLETWSEEADAWVVDTGKKKQELSDMETLWQQSKVSVVESAINNYQKDQIIPELYSELRVTTFTEAQYYQLLMDRKLLAEYLIQPDFPDCPRPALSGLAT
ncbi:hypothetical protein HC752_21875 [Vibrio sp. S9_S30]|uniref:hypothetical protein n=1 Tax=Vibrio sp. S9_S30 TaxID=2720226 RepID=UPI0016811823|nr:hypothetical protein [Vibrio sp. S9_S30]MBD1559596.1 hypothetical protein [Vibrio sp. S9_S30]